MSTYVPPASVLALNDGDPLPAKPLKDLAASLQAFLNGMIGNPNINTIVDPTEKIAYNKLALAGMIQAGDIAGVSFSTFTTLKATAQASPNNTVRVAAGTYLSLNGLLTRVYAGGNSAAFGNTSAPGQNRIDLLSIDDTGTLQITVGAEGGAPTAPNYPSNVIPVAEIYIRYSGTGVVIKDADDSINSYIRRDVRNLLQFAGVPDDSITLDKLANGSVGWVDRLEGTSDLADPGTSYVTMTGMNFASFNVDVPAGAGVGVAGCLLDFDAVFELNCAGGPPRNYPLLDVRLMVGNAGSAAEVHHTGIDLRNQKGAGDLGDTIILPLHLSYQAIFPGAGLKDARIEWKRTNGASGTATVRQIGATYKRVFNMTMIHRAGAP